VSEPPLFTVRRASLRDSAGILDCLRAAFEPYREAYSPGAFEDTVLTPGTIGHRLASMAVFVASADRGEVVGTIASGLVGEGEGHLRGMAVSPDWQGRGVAEELLTAAEAELRRAGCDRASLDTTRYLGRAIRFYEANGYRASGKVGDFFGMELIEYVKTLRGTDVEPTVNTLGQPVGFPLPGWVPPPAPPREPMSGRYCRLEPLDPDRHAASLFEANAAEADGRSWTYLAYGPFQTLSDYRAWMEATCLGTDPLFFAIVDAATGRPGGVASYLRITPAAGSIEVGHLHYSPQLKRTPASTEAMYLMMERAFGLGYRRYEWKCDALNAASRAAALRLGLSFEGVFRQATVYKGRNRDTAWFAAVDTEWPALRAAFLAWLDPGNFDADGRHRTRLSALTGPVLKQHG
jgi:RimJ/RimL family protein N-acetyltransferase